MRVKHAIPLRKFQDGQRVSFKWRVHHFDGKTYTPEWDEHTDTGVVQASSVTGDEDVGYYRWYFIKWDKSPGAHNARIREDQIQA